jgi:signal transduction histidine kinase
VAQLVSSVTDMVVPAGFRVVCPDPLPTFLTDRLSLEQVFTNLIGNAVKYHNQLTGTITINCRDLDRGYEFRVQDDGPGIAPEYHEKIFLIFQTLRDRHTVESTGIGLSIVKKIIDEQKGSIYVESEPGQGATFVFTWLK